MMYDEAIMDLSKSAVYTRKELFKVLEAKDPGLNYNSFKWKLPELLGKGLIFRKGYDSYSRYGVSASAQYAPAYSEGAQMLKNLIHGQYPLADFCIFESFLLNEFLNHQIVQNTMVVQVEKEVGGFLFDFLDENWDGRVLYKPDRGSFQRYWRGGCVIIVGKVSEAPGDSKNPHDMVLEKLVVDIFAEKVVKSLFSPSEYPLIMETVLGRYLVDERKMMRYARRRNVAARVMEYMG
jgi:hypothetical protein